MLTEILEREEILSALEALGFSPAKMFADLTASGDALYAGRYHWVKSDCHVEGIDREYVINAIPDDWDRLAWEEWYASGGKLVHHILCRDKWPECTDEAFIPADDTNHPDAIKGKHWYYFEDADMRPYFAR